MSRLMQTPSEQAIRQANRYADRTLDPTEFRAAADSPLSPDERAGYHELIDWFSRRYQTAAERLAYVRRTMSRIAHAPSRPTALLVEAYVTPGGRRAAYGEAGCVRVCLMNVLRFTATDFSARWALLCQTIQRVCEAPPCPTVLLTPGGYFGHDSVNGQGRLTLAPGHLDRTAVMRALTQDLRLPAELLLAVGVDWSWDHQTLQLVSAQGPTREIVRGQTSAASRVYEFAGLKWFGVICGEFMRRTPFGPMYGPPNRTGAPFFDAQRDVRGQGVDVVLNAAHVGVKCRQRSGTSASRFPFERFCQEVSQAGAAAFLSHHHPDELMPDGGPRNDSYSNWGIYAGTGADTDWLAPDAPVHRIEL